MLPQLPEKYKKDILIFGGGKWKKPTNLKVIKNIHQWEVLNLSAWKNQREEVIKDISHIQFVNLTSLNLAENMITSIEGLAHIQMPHLEKLTINCNRIICARDLKKVHWPSMKALDIADNYICDAENLLISYFPKLEKIIVENHHQKNQIFDLKFIFKLQTKAFRSIGLKYYRQDLHPHLKVNLLGKWKDVQIWIL